jgi:hypothetical protein
MARGRIHGAGPLKHEDSRVDGRINGAGPLKPGDQRTWPLKKVFHPSERSVTVKVMTQDRNQFMAVASDEANPFTFSSVT